MYTEASQILHKLIKIFYHDLWITDINISELEIFLYKK
jgi:hypothetical protein